MFAYIKGKCTGSMDNIIIVESASGIGFKVNTSKNTINNIPIMGIEIKLYTKLCVKEDNIELYGFSTQEELELFELLITVSGIGPKGAVNILSFLTPSGVKTAILTDNIDLIKKSPGIGLKTAQKLVIELKNKIKDIKLEDMDDIVGTADNTANESYNDAVDALESLGYSTETVLRILNSIQNRDEKTAQELIKEALRFINGKD